jgi:hypothetical protein
MLNKQLLQAICKPTYQRFMRALDNPAQEQERLLRKFIRELARTRYGAAHGITGNESYREFTAKVPVRDFDQLDGWVALQLSSRRSKILTPHPVIHVEPTSGSSGIRKSIPYTLPLLKSFTNMFAIWAYDILTNGPSFESLRTFISVSEGGTGFASDKDYLRGPLRWLVGPHLVPKAELSAAEELEIISVWSPSYLLVLLEQLPKRSWPKLKLISCWGDGPAELQFEKLRERFPQVQLQRKGLLSTEAPITIPLIAAGGCVPLVTDVFFEFESAQLGIKLVDQLELNHEYQVIVTQAAGLTRYRTHDVVRVTGFYNGLPLLKFVGRANQVCDLVGEKLNAQFVHSSLRKLIPSEPFVVVPDDTGYVLVSETPVNAATADKLLCEAHHYAVARQLRQLSSIRNFVVPNLSATMQNFFHQQGMKRGDVKETFLMINLNQAQKFIDFIGAGEYNFAPPAEPKLAQMRDFLPVPPPPFPSAVGT